MNKIDTIETISDTLADNTIVIEPKRCSYIRNWNSKCKACLNICPSQAITRSIGRLSINADACTDCAACVAACPTSTFVTTAPTVKEQVRQARAKIEQNNATVIFACMRHAEQSNINPAYAVILPCLDYLDEYLITGLFAFGAKEVSLIGCDCEGCTTNSGTPFFPQAVKNTKALLKQWKIEAKVSEHADVPQKICLKGKHRKTVTSDRRQAFRQAGGSVASFLLQTVDDVVGTITGEPIKVENPNKQIIVHLDERFPADSYRSARLLKMLDYLGTRPYGATVESRFWASIDIDKTQCKYCGGCARMCATQALKHVEDNYGKSTLTFEPALCVNCGLCKDSCLTHSMVYSNKVLADDLDRGTVKTLYKDCAETKKKSLFS